MKHAFPLLVSLPLILTLAACGDAPGGGGGSGGGDLCLASTWRDRFIGAPEQQVRFEVGPLVTEGRARILAAGERPTGPTYSNRLTFQLGRDGRLASISCG